MSAVVTVRINEESLFLTSPFIKPEEAVTRGAAWPARAHRLTDLKGLVHGPGLNDVSFDYGPGADLSSTLTSVKVDYAGPPKAHDSFEGHYTIELRFADRAAVEPFWRAKAYGADVNLTFSLRDHDQTVRQIVEFGNCALTQLYTVTQMVHKETLVELRTSGSKFPRRNLHLDTLDGSYVEIAPSPMRPRRKVVTRLGIPK